MLEDPVRLELQRKGIHAVVRPGDVVVEIGAAMGTCSVYAAEAGARAVYAIELGRIIDVAREVAARTQYADRIHFIEAFSTDVTLPEPADVVFFEDFCSFLVFDEIKTIYNDAKARFLKPGGRVMPLRGRIHVAPFENADWYKRIDRWGDDIETLHGLNFSPIREMMVNKQDETCIQPEQLLSPPQLLREIDFATETEFDLSSELIFRSERPATAHGLAVWFDLELGPGVILDNAPGRPSTVWEQGALPFEHPLELGEGETLEIDLRTVQSAAYGYHWNWITRLESRDGGLPILFRQSTFRGELLPKSLAHALTFNR
jgi:protein arginine N-methyltransferase 1